jgi:hypothetical protein
MTFNQICHDGNTRYQTGTDAELIEKIRAGDRDALFRLIGVKYQKKLYGVIYKQLMLNPGIKYVDNDLLEYWLYKFYVFMSVPTKTEKKSKFESIKTDEISSWLCTCCINFLKKEFKESNVRIIYIDSYDGSHEDEISEIHDIEGSVNSTDMLRQFTLTIEAIDKALTSFEKYIVLTYLCCEKKCPDLISHLDTRIANILSSTKESVRKTKSAAYRKIKLFINKITAKKQYINVYKDIKTCYDNVYMIRKSAMAKLGIENDFIENDIEKIFS